MTGGLFVKEINPSVANPNDRMTRLRFVANVRSRVEVFMELHNVTNLRELSSEPRRENSCALQAKRQWYSNDLQLITGAAKAGQEELLRNRRYRDRVGGQSVAP
jgi:hypothetical protein